MKAIDPNTTVGQIVTEKPARSEVFEKLGIDYCCGGKVSLAAACADKSLDVESVVQKLQAHDEIAGQEEKDWANIPLSTLADHIVATHHAYLHEALPRLVDLGKKVAAAHGARHPETKELSGVICDLAAELKAHLEKEEVILFPMIRQLDTAPTQVRLHCGSIENPISVMESDHRSTADALQRIRELTHDFTAPDDACNTFRALLDGLATTEADTHRHIHKEESILFPRAIQRQKDLTTAP